MQDLDQDELNRLHERAMHLAEEARLTEKSNGKQQQAKLLWAAAFDHERRVAQSLLPRFDLEPSRGIIFRSAAALALRFGDYDTAEKHAAQGLAGSVDEKVAHELRDILDEVQLLRHMANYDSMLGEEKLHIGMTGARVSASAIEADLLVDHIRILRRIVLRLQELRMGYQFRQSGRVTKEVNELLQIRYQPASNGVFGYDLDVVSQQPQFDAFESSVKGIVDGAGKVFELASLGRKNALLELCNQNLSYYRFFVNSVRDALPDGRRFAFMSLVSNDRATNLQLRRTDRATVKRDMAIHNDDEVSIERTGLLLGATGDPTSSETLVRIVDDLHGKRGETFSVPDGLSGDRIGELWSKEVKVIGYKGPLDKHPRIEFIDETKDNGSSTD